MHQDFNISFDLNKKPGEYKDSQINFCITEIYMPVSITIWYPVGGDILLWSAWT